MAQSGKPRTDRRAAVYAAARETVLAGGRLDLGELARSESVSRASVHRWFGPRELLLDRILGEKAAELAGRAAAEAVGDGDELVCDFTRRIIESALELPAVSALVAREPRLAMRLVLRRDGSIHRAARDGILTMLRRAHTPHDGLPPHARIDLMVQVASGLVWSTEMVGEGPRVDDAVAAVRALLTANRD